MSNTKFDQISLRQNPAITLPSGDSITNSSSGSINMGNAQVKAGSIKLLSNAEITNTSSGRIDITGVDIYAGHFIGNSNSYPGNTYYVSPNFANNASVHTYTTIGDALNAISSSGTIIVFEGTYSETITAKSNVSIIGVSEDKVIITSSSYETVFISGVTNFELKNLTIVNTNAQGYVPEGAAEPNPGSAFPYAYSSCITLDSSSNIKFVNLVVKKETPTSGVLVNILAEGSSFEMDESFVYSTETGPDGAILVYLRNGSSIVCQRDKFKTKSSDGASEYSIYDDSGSGTVNVGYSQNQSGTNFIISTTGSVEGISYHNISNKADSSFNNHLSTTYNIVDNQFTIS